ncbi:hypothetical protein EGW08_020960 [Elysia chlorotica]|uniref:Uncharacterized protein n=1 Tax=Elysia chlorotica TaxID=188477 RepID=A0A433SPZ3_ELYCH|nr:hypothetical protein EGW08_020960 [Elysia chlorotica]
METVDGDDVRVGFNPETKRVVEVDVTVNETMPQEMDVIVEVGGDNKIGDALVCPEVERGIVLVEEVLQGMETVDGDDVRVGLNPETKRVVEVDVTVNETMPQELDTVGGHDVGVGLNPETKRVVEVDVTVNETMPQEMDTVGGDDVGVGLRYEKEAPGVNFSFLQTTAEIHSFGDRVSICYGDKKNSFGKFERAKTKGRPRGAGVTCNRKRKQTKCRLLPKDKRLKTVGAMKEDICGVCGKEELDKDLCEGGSLMEWIDCDMQADEKKRGRRNVAVLKLTVKWTDKRTNKSDLEEIGSPKLVLKTINNRSRTLDDLEGEGAAIASTVDESMMTSTPGRSDTPSLVLQPIVSPLKEPRLKTTPILSAAAPSRPRLHRQPITLGWVMWLPFLACEDGLVFKPDLVQIRAFLTTFWKIGIAIHS